MARKTKTPPPNPAAVVTLHTRLTPGGAQQWTFGGRSRAGLTEAQLVVLLDLSRTAYIQANAAWSNALNAASQAEQARNNANDLTQKLYEQLQAARKAGES